MIIFFVDFVLFGYSLCVLILSTLHKCLKVSFSMHIHRKIFEKPTSILGCFVRQQVILELGILAPHQPNYQELKSMAAQTGSSLVEGQLTNRPPLFNNTNYTYWEA